MKIHHLNCISTCPAGGRLMDGRSPPWAWRGRLCCHCVLIELDAGGLALIDTGLGMEDLRDPGSRLSAFFLALVKPEWRESMTARRQVEALGFSAADVRHIVLTHLDFDHAGGLDDFPQATVHLMKREVDVALRQGSWMDRQRFRPQQWSSRPRWRHYEPGEGEPWYGFARARPLDGLPPEIALIPLAGHTFGHAGVAVQAEGCWRLLAGDAYFHADEMSLARPGCPVGLRFYQWMLEHDRAARLGNQHRLRELIRSNGDRRHRFQRSRHLGIRALGGPRQHRTGRQPSAAPRGLNTAPRLSFRRDFWSAPTVTAIARQVGAVPE